MRLAGLVTAGLAVSNAFLGSNQGNGGGRSEFHKPRSLSENSTNATNSTAPLESSYVSKYPECQADVNSDMNTFYGYIYNAIQSDKKAEFDTLLSDSGLTTSENKLNFLLEFVIDNPIEGINHPTSAAALTYLQTTDDLVYNCIDTRPNARYYEQCRVDRTSENAEVNSDAYYVQLYAGLGDTPLKTEYDVQFSNSGLTNSFDKTDFILEYYIDNYVDLFATPSERFVYLQTTEDLGHNCIDPNTSSSPTSNPTSQPTIDVSQYTDICKADRTQSEADTQAEQYELYRRIHPDYQSGVYTVLTNATSLTEYEKLDSVFEYCIKNPGSLYCDTAESAYNWLRTDFKLYPYKLCANLGLTESPTLAPSAAPSPASTTGQLTDNPTSSPSLNPTIQITEIDCSELSYSEKKDCLLMNSLFETSEKAKNSYNIDFELQSGSFQSMYDGLSVDPNSMIHTYREFESLVPSFTYASGASVFKSMSLGCQVSALTMLDSDVTATYSSLDQFMTLCSSSVISEVQKKDEDAYALMQRLSLDVDVMLENTDTINDEISKPIQGSLPLLSLDGRIALTVD